MDVIIYHNPACGTSRNALNPIRNSGILIERMDIPIRDAMRQKGTPFADLGLDDQSLDNDAPLDAVMAHPILINRPIVVSPKGVRLSRPSEAVIDLLPPQQGEFRKENGELLIDARGQLVAE